MSLCILVLLEVHFEVKLEKVRILTQILSTNGVLLVVENIPLRSLYQFNFCQQCIRLYLAQSQQ